MSTLTIHTLSVSSVHKYDKVRVRVKLSLFEKVRFCLCVWLCVAHSAGRNMHAH